MIEAAVAVVVGNGGMRECALRLARKSKCIALEREGAVALIHERAEGPVPHTTRRSWQSVVPEIGEESAGGIVEDADAGLFRHVLKGAVPAIAIEAVG